MKSITCSRLIHAPVSSVFEVIAHIDRYSEAIPDILNVEFLTEKKRGAGVRFRETRQMGKREAATELEITEYVENDHVRYVSDSHGSVWDSTFTVKPEGDGTRLELKMDARAHKFISGIFNRLIRGMIAKAVDKDVDSVKAYCEKAG